MCLLAISISSFKNCLPAGLWKDASHLSAEQNLTKSSFLPTLSTWVYSSPLLIGWSTCLVLKLKVPCHGNPSFLGKLRQFVTLPLGLRPSPGKWRPDALSCPSQLLTHSPCSYGPCSTPLSRHSARDALGIPQWSRPSIPHGYDGSWRDTILTDFQLRP